MLELPKTAKIKGNDGKLHETEMWKYWMLQEGIIGVEPDFLKTNDGNQPPVIHVDSTAPLYSDATKKLITDKIWGLLHARHVGDDQGEPDDAQESLPPVLRLRKGRRRRRAAQLDVLRGVQRVCARLRAV